MCWWPAVLQITRAGSYRMVSRGRFCAELWLPVTLAAYIKSQLFSFVTCFYPSAGTFHELVFLYIEHNGSGYCTLCVCALCGIP